MAGKISEMEAGYNPSSNLWEVIVKYNGDILRLEPELNARVEILNKNYAVITLKREQIAFLKGYSEIIYVELPKTLSLEDYPALVSSCVTEVQSENGYGLLGEGVIVAVIDSGIDYTHLDFKNDDGTSRILYIWDQTAEGTPPDGFKSGAEFTNEDINNALSSANPYSVVPSLDTVGHGTAVTGIAAGNGRASGGDNVGVAPKASIISVKLGRRGQQSFARTTELMRAVKYIVEKAAALNMPVAINISYGSNYGAHDGSSIFETFIDDMSSAWKNVIVAAMGNEGIGGHHYQGNIGSNQAQTVNFFTSGGLDSFFISMWKNFVDVMSVELIVPSGKTTGEINFYEFYKNAQAINIDNFKILINYGQPSNYSVNQEIYFQLDAARDKIPEGLWQLKIRAKNIVNGIYNLWLPTIESVSEKTAFSEPDAYLTLTLPATARSVISVGGYDSKLNTSAIFSGRGDKEYLLNSKPDLVAPAVNIKSASKNGGYDAFSGTSIAAPFVTGAAALMMEWGIVKNNDPFLYGQRVKAFLRAGAKQIIKSEYPNAVWGYGALCLENTIDYLLSYTI